MTRKPSPSKGKKATTKLANLSKDQIAIQSAIVVVRNTPVILASDLAEFFATTTKAVNQNRARNSDRFTQDYAFQLTPAEWENLKSQSVTPSQAHGGARTPPWAYSEHGVAMMSMGMQSEQAIRLSKVIIDTFVDYRRGTLPPKAVLAGPQALAHRRSLQEKIYKQMEQLLDVELPTSNGHTVRDEIGSIAMKALGRVKAVIDKPALENEKISAEVAKILAEAEKLYAETQKLNAETGRLIMENYRARLGFIRELRDMAQQLERDDWLETFDGSFGAVEQQLQLSNPDT